MKKTVITGTGALLTVLMLSAASVVMAEGRSGKEIYANNCIACHKTGAAGAPRVGNADSWGDRLDKDKETLYKNAINGIRAMPPMGTCTGCSKDEIRATVDYMLEQTR